MLLRQLLRAWLQNVAQQKVRQTVLDAAQQHLRAGAEPGETAEDTDAAQQQPPVGLVFALAIESGGLEDLLEDFVTTRGPGLTVRQGRLKGHALTLVLSGPGRDSAAKATEALIAGHRPRWVISTGFAGGLDSRLNRYDILLADRLVDTAGQQLSLGLEVDAAALAAVPGIHVGRLLMSDRIVRTPEEKRALGQQYDALAVDMETYAVAEACRLRQTRFLAVRVIHDAVNDKLPADVERLLSQKTFAAQFGAAAGAIFRRPASLKDLYGLKETSLLASDRLARFLAEMIQEL